MSSQQAAAPKSSTPVSTDPGVVVWVKFSKAWWSGRFAKESEVEPAIRKAKKPGTHLVYFFGSHDYSWAKLSTLAPFSEDQAARRKSNKAKFFAQGLREADEWLQEEVHNYPVWVPRLADEDSSDSESPKPAAKPSKDKEKKKPADSGAKKPVDKKRKREDSTPEVSTVPKKPKNAEVDKKEKEKEPPRRKSFDDEDNIALLKVSQRSDEDKVAYRRAVMRQLALYPPKASPFARSFRTSTQASATGADKEPALQIVV